MPNRNMTRLVIPDQNPVFGGNAGFERSKYAAAIEAGGLLFISGQAGLSPDGTIPEGDIHKQCSNAFDRLAEILRLKGLDFTDLVEIETLHVDIATHWAAFVEVKNRYMTGEYPAWTALGVPALARAPMLIEIRAVAALR